MIKLTNTEIQLIARQATNKLSLSDPDNKPSFEATFDFINDIFADIDSNDLSRQQFNIILGVFYNQHELQNVRSTAVLGEVKKAVNKTFDKLEHAKKAEKRAQHEKNMAKHAQKLADKSNAKTK